MLHGRTWPATMQLLPGTSPTKSTAPSPLETSEGRNHRTAPAGGIPGGTIPATRLRALLTPPEKRSLICTKKG